MRDESAALVDALNRLGHEGTNGVLGEVFKERLSQDVKWGEQNHPILSPNYPEDSRRFYETESVLWKAANADRAVAGTLAWDGILLEEVNEALAESDPVKIREELIQAAAVIVAMVESLDRALLSHDRRELPQA